MKKALLSTSSARRKIFPAEGAPWEASKRLVELLEQGYEVHIVTTRKKLDPEGADKCLFDLIPADRFWVPDPNLECASANSPGLIDVWASAASEVTGVAFEHLWLRTWLEIRQWAEEQGVVVR